MKTKKYINWLRNENYRENTIVTQAYRTSRVERYYGDLDKLYNSDNLDSLLDELKYSSQDRQDNRPNETKIPFKGDPYNNLGSYCDAIRRYKRFRKSEAGVLETREGRINKLTKATLTRQQKNYSDILLAINNSKQKELAKVFFDLAKYLLIVIAVSGFFIDTISWLAVIIAFLGSIGLLIVAFFITPLGTKEEK